MMYEKLTAKEEFVAKQIVESAFRVHVRLGPGMLESVYETCLCHELSKLQIPYQRQLYIPIVYDGLRIEQAFRLDLMVDDTAICELKSSENVTQVHYSQLLSYLRLTGKRLGFLINFNVPLLKDGIKRLIL